jgi:plastocyanin
MPTRGIRFLTAAVLIVALGFSLGARPAVAGSVAPEGGGGHRITKGITFPSFAAVIRYGVEHDPKPRRLRPPEEETSGAERAKELANNGKEKPTTKPSVEQIRGSLGRPGIVPAAWRPPSPDAMVAPAAPLLARTFAGVTGGSPPDSNLAAGPHNVVSIANTGIQIFAKNGTVVGATPTPALSQFFASLSPGGPFDPRAIFDPYLSRFWVIAGDVVNGAGSTPGTSQMLIALSATNDATGAWTFFSMNTRLQANTLVGQWCDYPMLGVSSDALFFSCNMFNFPAGRGTTGGAFQYAKVRQMTKSQFVSNTCCTWWDNWNLREGIFGGSAAAGVEPALMLDSGNTDEFLIDAHGVSTGSPDHVLEVWRITNTAVCCVPGNQQQPTWVNHDIGVGSFPIAPNAGQPGADTIATGDTRLLYALWQGDHLATGQTTACDDGSGGLDACASYTEIDVSSFPNSMSLLSDWVFHPANGTDEYFPAVAPDSSGNKTMVYTRSNSGLNPTASYVGIPASTSCTSCVSTPEINILAGSAVATCGTSPCTAVWGDYHGAARDPDGMGVWVSGQALGPVGAVTRRISQVALTGEPGDFTPPVTTASLNPAPSDNGTNTSRPVAVTLTSTDAGVGPWKITYSAKNGPVTTIPLTTVVSSTATLQVTLNGDTNITFHGTDNWGNVEADKTVTVNVDDRSQKIVFASTRDNNPNGAHELYVMNSDGSNQVRLTYNDADDTQPVLDSQGRVFFTSNRDGDYEIYRLDTSGTVTQLTQNTFSDLDPAVSEDGSKVAFDSDRSGNFEIYTMDSNGLNVSAPINPTPQEDVEPDWVRGTTRLAYVHNDQYGPDPRALYDDFNIYLTNPLEFLGTPGEDRRPAWRPDGYQVAAFLDGDIVVFDVGSGSQYHYLTSGAATDDAPTWSPHGGFIAFQTDRTGNNEIYRMTSAGGSLTNLTSRAGDDVEPDWMALGDGYGVGAEPPVYTIITRAGIVFPLKVHLDPRAPYTLLENQIILPPIGGLRFESASVDGGDCTIGVEGLTCVIGALEPGAARDLTVYVKAGQPGTYAMRVFTQSANGDPSSAQQMVRVLPETAPTADVRVDDAGYQSATLTVEQGTVVTWHFAGPQTQTVTDRSGIGLYDSGERPPGTTYTRSFDWAGTYRYGSSLNPALRGSVALPVAVQATGFDGGMSVGWGASRPPKGLAFDVQVRFQAIDSPWSAWTTWQDGTRLVAGLFEPDRGDGLYAFRARVRRPSTDASTGWSPPIEWSVGVSSGNPPR